MSSKSILRKLGSKNTSVFSGAVSSTEGSVKSLAEQFSGTFTPSVEFPGRVLSTHRGLSSIEIVKSERHKMELPLA